MNILILEDEEAAARRLISMLHEIGDYEILDTLDSIEASLNWFLKNPQPDLILMDIHIGDGSSFEIFKHVTINKPVVFITAYDQYALDAFKVNAVDYLLKPIKPDDLKLAVQKVKNRTNAVDYQLLASEIEKQQAPKRIMVKMGQTVKLIELNEVAYYYTQNKITFAISKNGKRYPLDISLDKVESMLNPNFFYRINRQFIVSINAIQEMYVYSKSRLKINLNPPSELESVVSAERSPSFKKWLVGNQ